MNDMLLESAWAVYITLLRMTVTIRLKYQPLLCDLRAALAAATGQSEEVVQVRAEEAAIEQGGLI